LHQGVIVVDEHRGRLVGQTHVGRHGLVFVGRVVHVASHLVEKSHLRVGLGQFLGILVGIAHGLAGVHLQLDHVVAALVILELPLGVAQFGVDLLESAVDKLLGAHGNLVLILVGLTVIADGQLLEIVDRALRVLIAEHQLRDGGGLAGLRNAQRAYIFICGISRRLDDDLELSTVDHRGDGVGGEAQDAGPRADGGGECGEGLVDVERSVGRILVDRHEIGAGDLILVALAGNEQVDGGVELFQVGGIDIHADGLCAVEQLVYHLAHMVIVHVELQVANGLLGQ